MRLSTEVDSDRLKPLVAEFAAIVGIDAWRERASILQREMTQNPFLAPHIQDRHRLELRFPKFVDLVRLRPLRDSDNQEYHDIIGFVTITARLYRSLSPQGQNSLAGMLRHGLQDSDNGLLPLEHEINTLTHLLVGGYDIIPHDLEQNGGFDFLATLNDASLEVECKMVSGDLGRMVPRRHVRMLYLELQPVFTTMLRGTPGAYFAHIQLNERLSANRGVHEDIAQGVSRAFESDSHANTTDASTTTIRKAAVSRPLNPKTLTYRELRAFVANHFGANNGELLFAGNSNTSIIVSVEGRNTDHHFKSLLSNLKRAAKNQLTGERPACLVVSFIDIAQQNLFELYQHDSRHSGQPNDLQYVTTSLMERRPQVIEVAYVTRDAFYGDRRRGFSYYFPNWDHPLSADIRYHPFRIKE